MALRRRKNKGKINWDSMKAELTGEREGDPVEIQDPIGLKE
jgi:hypothetical protein